jgi:hypothetical protein
MLKRTITLLGLTITVGALLLTLGCGGSNSNPVAPVSSDQPLVSRQENQPPNAPYLWFPWNGYTIVGGKVTFIFTATDPNGDMLKYRIEVQNGSETKVFNTGYYGSGQWVFFTVSLPVGDYSARVKAIDDKGAEGPYNNPDRVFKVR